MLKCILSFIVFQCENSLCSSHVGKCQCIWQLHEAETLPILLYCYTDTANLSLYYNIPFVLKCVYDRQDS